MKTTKMRPIHFLGTLLLGAAVLAAPLVGSARAEGPDNHRRNDHGSWQERGRQNEHWRPQYRVDGYYSAPPVVIVPSPYYDRRPGASLNFNFPLFR